MTKLNRTDERIRYAFEYETDGFGDVYYYSDKDLAIEAAEDKWSGLTPEEQSKVTSCTVWKLPEGFASTDPDTVNIWYVADVVWSKTEE